MEALGGEDSDELGARMVDHGDPSGLLVDVMRHFSSPLFVEVLRSVCLKAVAFAAHATGFLLHKVMCPVTCFVDWCTFGGFSGSPLLFPCLVGTSPPAFNFIMQSFFCPCILHDTK